MPLDGHSGGERPAGWVGRSVHSDGHSFCERPEEWVGRSVHPDTGKAAGRRVGRSVAVHPEAQNSQRAVSACPTLGRRYTVESQSVGFAS